MKKIFEKSNNHCEAVFMSLKYDVNTQNDFDNLINILKNDMWILFKFYCLSRKEYLILSDKIDEFIKE